MEAEATIIDLRRASGCERMARSRAKQKKEKRASARERMARSRAKQKKEKRAAKRMIREQHGEGSQQRRRHRDDGSEESTDMVRFMLLQ